MADLSPDKIIEPLSDDQPCGPDLDMEFDMDFMNFMAEVDGRIPTRYFSFDPGSLNFPDMFEQIDGFLDRTRDIRLLVPLAKLKILNGNIDGFIEAIVAMDALLKAHWADVHPQAADFLELRTGQLSTLDDMPNSVLPLQHATLLRSRRAGAISLRKWQVANGDVNPREEEEKIDGGTILNEIGEADPEEMSALIAKMEKGRDAINSIRTICISEGDFDSAPVFEKLPEAFDEIIELIAKGTGADLGGEAAAADGGSDDAAGSGTGGGAAGAYVQLPTGDVKTREDAIEALFQAERYYALHETSSPIVLLLREARSAANKTFAELVTELLPSSASAAFFTFGKEPWFEVPLNDINYRNPAPDYETDAASADDSWEDAGLDDEPTDNDLPAEESADDEAAADENQPTGSDESAENDTPAEDAASADDEEASPAEEAAPAAEGESASGGWDWGSGGSSDEASSGEAEASSDQVEEAGDDAASAEETEPVVIPAGSAKFNANTRPEALSLIEKALAYYRVAEPSSPVALMLERAIEMSSKNFLGLLREVLPDGHLKVKQSPGSEDSGSGW